MGLIRKAGEIFEDPKTAGRLGATNSAAQTGFDLWPTVRAIGSQLHPILGAADDLVNITHSTQRAQQDPAKVVTDSIATTGSVGGLIPRVGPSIGKFTGPLGLAIGVGAGIGGWMEDNLEQGVGVSGRGAGRASF